MRWECHECDQWQLGGCVVGTCGTGARPPAAKGAEGPTALCLEQKLPRPPNDRNQGRKPIKEGQATVCMTIRLTAGQREKLAQFGGAKWIREKIDKATTVRFKDTRT